MGDIHVDASVLGANLDSVLGPQISQALSVSVQNSLAVVRSEWIRRVQNSLNSTRPLYLLGLDFDSVVYPLNNNPFSGAVMLRGKFPNMLEQGFPAFDQKIGFSKSSKKHTSKDGGWYLTIPFRHSVPGSFMYGNAMSKEIYSQAKQLGNGGRLSVKGDQKTSWTGYVHKNNIYDGLTRVVKSYNNPNTGKTTNQSQYFTFRRVSDKSDPLAFWHPGYKGVKLAQQLETYALQIFKAEVEKNLSRIK